jgi:G:T/U-mismatch repair DNA glycosylase
MGDASGRVAIQDFGNSMWKTCGLALAADSNLLARSLADQVVLVTG